MRTGVFYRGGEKVDAYRWEPFDPPSDMPDWTWNLVAPRPHLYDEASGVVTIRTHHGDVYAAPGDWIVLRRDGEIYASKPESFFETHDPAEEREMNRQTK